MGTFKKIMLAAFVSVTVSFLLMWLVEGMSDLNGKILDASTHPSDQRVTDQNLVDYMANLPLQLPILNVGWKGSILSVDLLSIPGNTNEAMVYKDLYTLSQFGLQKMANINQVRVRIMESSGTETRE